MAGDDADGGATSVTEGAAAAVVLIDGEEDGEVQRIEGVAADLGSVSRRRGGGGG